MTTSSLVGQKLRQALKDKNMSQQQLAELISMQANALSRRIRGVSPFDVDELSAISRALNMPMTSFIEAPAAGDDK